MHQKEQKRKYIQVHHIAFIYVYLLIHIIFLYNLSRITMQLNRMGNIWTSKLSCCSPSATNSKCVASRSLIPFFRVLIVIFAIKMAAFHRGLILHEKNMLPSSTWDMQASRINVSPWLQHTHCKLSSSFPRLGNAWTAILTSFHPACPEVH